jgi:hypothetical protein
MKINYDFIAKRYSRVEGGELLGDYFLRLQAEDAVKAANAFVPKVVEFPFQPTEKQEPLMSYLLEGHRFSTQRYLADKFGLSVGSVNGLLVELADAGYEKCKDRGKNYLAKK